MKFFIQYNWPERKKYVHAMLNAINKARRSIWMFEQQESKTNGLRVIRRFELVNKTTFNPFDKTHIEHIHGNGNNESLIRRLELVFKDHKKGSDNEN